MKIENGGRVVNLRADPDRVGQSGPTQLKLWPDQFQLRIRAPFDLTILIVLLY